MSIPVCIVLIAFFATLVRSTFGFGESLVGVPLFALLIPLDTAVPLSVLMSVLVALVILLQDHQHIHLKSAKWLILFALMGIPFGLAVLAYGNEYWVKIVLGMLIIGNSWYTLQKKSNRPLNHNGRWWLFICGFLSGVLGGAYGLNGPPLVVYGNFRRWSPARFRATLQAYFLPVSLLGLVGYGAQGLLDKAVFMDFLYCAPAILPAIFMGRYLNRQLRGGTFFKYIYWGLIVIGGLLIVVTLNRPLARNSTAVSIARPDSIFSWKITKPPLIFSMMGSILGACSYETLFPDPWSSPCPPFPELTWASPDRCHHFGRTLYQ